MFRPGFMIRLDKVFEGYVARCLGEQLIQIIQFVIPLIPPHTWYAGHLDANYIHEPLFKFRDFELKKVGSDIDLLEIAKITDQFLSGVFIAASDKSTVPEGIVIDTEDKKFRELDIEEVFIEIRAFDTSYFEVYSEDKTLMDKISLHFGESILLPES